MKHPRNRRERLQLKSLKNAERKPRAKLEAAENSNEIEICPVTEETQPVA